MSDTAGVPRSGSSRKPSGTFLVVTGLVVLALLVAVIVWRRTKQIDVVLFGDSITAISETVLTSSLESDYNVAVAGDPGDRADERVSEALPWAERAPSQVVINLGTNDVMQATPADLTIQSLTAIATSFSSARCVHLVTVTDRLFSMTDGGMGARAAELNVRIRVLAAERGWRLIPWDAAVRDYDAAGSPQGPLTSDTVHPTEIGQHLLADLYRKSIASC